MDNELLREPHGHTSNVAVEEFLYMDPDSGIIVCMIADGDGFRPATARQELESIPLHWIAGGSHSQASETNNSLTSLGEDSLDDFVKSFEHAYLAPSPG